MKKTFLKQIFAFVMALALIVPVLAIAPSAKADANNLLWANKQGEVHNNIGLGDTDPRTIAASIIRVVLGFLGIIAVIIMIAGGFKWMTSGGDDGKIGDARGMIIAGFIGLLIILAAYGIAVYVMEAIYTATGANS